jgi:hypothetical protein
LNFGAEDNDTDETFFDSESWQLLIFSTSYESDETYDFDDSHEGRKIYPKRDSFCQLLLDKFGPDVKRNLTEDIIDQIWCHASSMRFLEWFMASTDSETLTVCKETGRSPIRKLFFMWDFRGISDDFDLSQNKIKFLARKGASLHYSKNDVSITKAASRKARSWLFWCITLLELEVDLSSFAKQEFIQGAFQGWIEVALVILFDQHRFILERRDVYEWDDEFLCSNCEDPVPTFWEVYLMALEKLRELRQSVKIGDDVNGTSEKGHVDAGAGVDEGDDVNGADDANEADDADEADNVNYINLSDNLAEAHKFFGTYIEKLYRDYPNIRDSLCGRCYETSKLRAEMQSSQPPMPGSFIP